MENDNQLNSPEIEQAPRERSKRDYLLPVSIMFAALVLGGALIYTAGETPTSQQLSGSAGKVIAKLGESILPKNGAKLPVRWGNLGAKLVEAGVIDASRLESLYANRGGLDKEMKELLYGLDNGNLKITQANSGLLLNMLWALGLGNKNDVLEKGPMMDSRYGGAGNFASTGGWTLAKGGAMDHYSRHSLIVLTPEQQALVERVAKGIYRPCCGNSTYFPDCNHGMAMLGFLELMAAQGVSEDEMYRAALQVNAYWFPDTYLTIAKYLESKGTSWQEANPKELLGYNFSSASGYRQILTQTTPPEQKSGGGGCGV